MNAQPDDIYIYTQIVQWARVYIYVYIYFRGRSTGGSLRLEIVREFLAFLNLGLRAMIVLRERRTRVFPMLFSTLAAAGDATLRKST